ncbi:ArsR family transcriptional regulator [Haladaptatus sp. CMAA 1911]|uniref:ArsR family transcriptional regulator n=1 Tax=unclassified Haladaptatus TaxID=2622732 RepID=UPI0037553CC6
MNPNPTDDGSPDTWHILQAVTNESRANIIADIVGHPQDAPSVDELDEMNSSLEKDTIRGHLSVLKDVGVVDVAEIPVGERTRGYPYKFYQLSERARDLFDENGLFPEEAWKRQYKRVAKSPEIRELEQMPRPSLENEENSDNSKKVTAD